MSLPDPVAAFLEAATVPLSWHASGSLDLAEEILATHTGVATADIFTAAVLGDADAVRGFLQADPGLVKAKGGPRDWDALTHLAFSQYLRLDPSKSHAFLETAEVLLDAGADVNTGFFDSTFTPEPILESVIYGAAGLARHPGLTKLLLERGADPNDAETPYHAPETYDNAALKVLLDSGKLNADSLATVLLRKADWHDGPGMKLALDAGADPNRMTQWLHTAFQHAIRRDNDIVLIDLLLDRGADPLLPNRQNGLSGLSMAVHHGRKDILDSLRRRGIPIDLGGTERLLAACADGDGVAALALAKTEPRWQEEILRHGGTLLAAFASVGNADGMRCLLDLGVDVHASYGGDGYHGIARGSTALHVAAWRGRHEAVRLMTERGASVDRPDGKGRTPLMLAVKACVDSYWSWRRGPDSVKTLLEAGASKQGVKLPTGYDEIDVLLMPDPA